MSMKVLVIFLSVLGAWWGLLTISAVRSYLARVQDAKVPLTPEEIEESRRLDHSMSRFPKRARDYFILTPFMLPFALLLLPLFVYYWFLKFRDPCDRDKV